MSIFINRRTGRKKQGTSGDETMSRPRVMLGGILMLCALLSMAALVWIARNYTAPEPLNQARIVERQKALLVMNAANQQALGNYEWVDASKGTVHIPIQRAMELSAKYWKDPAVGRSNLLSRIE